MRNFQAIAAGSILPLTLPTTLDPSVHQWSQPEIDSLTLAQAAQRPLLVRGEPGTGKTQLARAASQFQDWQLLAQTVHPRFEAQDLVYRFDAVRRLADAQAQKLGQPGHQEADYWEPGPLWRAYGWDTARAWGSCRTQAQPAGHVILIDEIDKADSDLPNSLLEVLGQRSFYISPLRLTAGGPTQQRPLVVITTNEERELPAAFLRRCVVLNLAPKPDLSYRDWLVERALAHFGATADTPAQLDLQQVIRPAADQLVEDRDAALAAGQTPPGPAEFLDLLYALLRLAPGDANRQRELIAQLSAYAFIKNGSLPEQPKLHQTRKALLPSLSEPA